MQTLLGLLLFSLLLATGASLQCEICTAVGGTCSSDYVDCPAGQDTCALVEYGPTPPKVTVSTTVKGCHNKAACEEMKKQVGTSVEVYGTIKKVECNNAPAAAASLLLAFSSLMLMKIIL